MLTMLYILRQNRWEIKNVANVARKSEPNQCMHLQNTDACLYPEAIVMVTVFGVVEIDVT